MSETRITIYGKPIAKKRPRFYRRGNHVGTYNDQTTEEGRWLWEASSQVQEKVQADIPVNVRLIFYMPIPKSTSKKRMSVMTEHVKKPDLDNLVKFVKDCLNGVAWHDDSQVSSLNARKVYSDNPRTEIIIKW